jgi:tetratricopeptide (TPR) repeat protein
MRRQQHPPIRPRAAALLIVLSCACSSPGTTVDTEKMLELHSEMALRYFDQGDLMRAEDQVSKGLDIDPKNEQLQLMLGWIRQRRGGRDDIQIAEKIFRSLLDTEDYRAELGLAEALERKGILYNEAATAIASGARQSTAADPEQQVARLRTDSASFWNESVRWYERVLERRPEDPQAMNGLMRVYSLCGENEQSWRWAQALAAQTQAELDFWKGRIGQPDIDADEERRFREIVLKTTDLLAETHMHASTLARRLGRPQEALEHLDSVLALQPERADAFSRRAVLLCDLERYDEAIPAIDEFLRLSTLGFEHPDIQRAFQVKEACLAALAAR